jgi:N-acetyl-anhydromuramyl-L-alanine amidase AmpD
MGQQLPVESRKTKLDNNQKTAEQLSTGPIKATNVKCNQCITITLQTKFVHTEDKEAAWPGGPAVKAAKVELLEPGIATTSDKNGKATLDGSKLSSGLYTLKLTPAPGNTWDAAHRNDYTSDKRLTPRYMPAQLILQISREGNSLKVEKAEAFDDGMSLTELIRLPFRVIFQNPPTPLIPTPIKPPPDEPLGLRVNARVSGNDILIDWRPAWVASPNRQTRSSQVSMILVHRTGYPFGSAMNTFTNDKSTSAHYLVDTDGYVVNLVAETEMAYHAGHSWWSNARDLNAISVGIEIVNTGGPFTEQQYTALIQLLKDIMSRNPGVTRHRILAHSDIRVGYDGKSNIDSKDGLGLSTSRGVCPGPEFNWPRLMGEKLSSVPNKSLYGEDLINAEYGGFFKDKPQAKLSPGENDKSLVRKDNKPYGVIKALQLDLSTIGYSINVRDGVTATEVFDRATQTAVDRFRRHFMSGLVNLTGNLDPTFDRATALALKRVLLDRQKP